MKLKKTFSAILNLVFYLVIIFLSIFLLSNIGSSKYKIGYLGIKFLTVESNSMNPIFKKGDIIILRKVSPEKLKKNDIIGYTNYLRYTDGKYKKEIVTHYFNEKKGNEILTRRYNVAYNDTEKYDIARDENGNKTITTTNEIVGKYVLKISYLGFILGSFRVMLKDPIMALLIICNIINISLLIKVIRKDYNDLNKSVI